jgi:FPC/CPF motif-containing protein YcgG
MVSSCPAARAALSAASPRVLEARSAAFRGYVADASFPCVGARSALNRGRLAFGAYGRLGDGDAAAPLCDALGAFSAQHPDPGSDPVSFVALFEDDGASEAAFVDALWRQLRQVHAVDARAHDWDPTVSADPADGDFSFSVGGRAFFVVGLHPNASRLARRAPFPCLVFNFHGQFEAMKANGRYAGLQRATRARDVALQGFINPALARFGDASEARQYGGDATGADWVCPFQPRLPAHAG